MDRTRLIRLLNENIAEQPPLRSAQLVKHKLIRYMQFPEYGMVSHPVMINRLLMKRRDKIQSLQKLI